jgi:hypothetical protein
MRTKQLILSLGLASLLSLTSCTREIVVERPILIKPASTLLQVPSDPDLPAKWETTQDILDERDLLETAYKTIRAQLIGIRNWFIEMEKKYGERP